MTIEAEMADCAPEISATGKWPNPSQLREDSQPCIATQSDTDRPFRFLHLPLELQRNVLAKYYEEPWTVSSHRSNYDDTNTHRYRFSLSNDLLLVSHRLYTEAKLAIAESRGNTYIPVYHKFPITPAFFDMAVDKVEVDDLWDADLDALRTRFPRLRVIEWDGSDSEVNNEMAMILRGKSIFEILEGKHDDEIAMKLREKIVFWLEDTLGGEGQNSGGLCGLVFSGWIYSMEIGNTWDVEPVRDISREHFLDLHIEISATSVVVLEKRFGREDTPSKRIGIEATVESLRECCRM